MDQALTLHISSLTPIYLGRAGWGICHLERAYLDADHWFESLLHKVRPGAHPIILPKHRARNVDWPLLNRGLLDAGLKSSDTKKKLL
jgi:hypothetical protein